MPSRKKPEEPSKTPAAARARLRRRKVTDTEGIKADIEVMYGKPIEEWDLEELTRGRARNADGTFPAAKPPAAIAGVTSHELQRRLTTKTREELSKLLPTALSTLAKLMVSTEVDADGRPLVPASVKADIAKFLVEQRVGKARVSVDVDTPQVWDFLQQFSGGLLNRHGQAYRPTRGEPADGSPRVIDAEPDDDLEDRPVLPRWEGPDRPAIDAAPQPSVAGDDSPPDWMTDATVTRIRTPRR